MSSNRMVRSWRGHLLRALTEMGPADFLRVDLPIGIAGGVGALLLGLRSPERLIDTVGSAIGIVGVIVGAVLAGVSIQAAFLDASFLRKLNAIGRDPIRYLAPFLFTALVGVWALLSLLILGTLKPHDSCWLLTPIGTLSGFLVFYAVGSLIPGLSTLVQFIRLRGDAADVPDFDDDE